jgi:hypothetical protein
MKRSIAKYPYLWTAAFVVLVVAYAWVERENYQPIITGALAPDFTVVTLEGEPVSLSDYDGQVVMVSMGPPLVPMPLVLGMEEADAIAMLDSLGLVVGPVEEVFRFGRDQGIVVEQEPPADTPLEPGAQVRLAVGRRGR